LPRLKILFTSTLHTTFIREDIRLLQKRYDVDEFISSGILMPLRALSRVVRCDVTFTWFASVYAFFIVLLARVMRKRSIVVIGGVDAARIPEIHYGIWLSPWKAPLVKWALRHAHKVLAVDPSLEQEAKRLAAYDGTNIEYVPTGYDAGFWTPSGTKEPFVLTVASCHDYWRMKKKGIDVLFEAARRLSGVRFVVAGFAQSLISQLGQSIPENVEVIPFISRDELLGYYQRAAVYCQPSVTEGLPNSLCEAMLCECVAVGTIAGGIPTAIGEHGFLVPYGDAGQLAAAIEAALCAPREVGKAGRDYIAGTFTVERREESLRRILEEP
jgi:glycosyltransferase involved in cell wall biosynthesis